MIAGRAVARRASLLASLIVFSLAGVARAESVVVSVEPLRPEAHIGKPIGIEVSGEAGGQHRLFAFTLPWGESCPTFSSGESRFVTELTWLTAQEGVSLSPGAFVLHYSFVPSAGGVFPVCAYLAESLKEEPDASSFAQISIPIEAPYLEEGARIVKRLAVEREEREQRAAVERRQQEERERQATSETPKRAAGPAAIGCTVPYLVGHTLRGARKLLTRAHCRIGTIHKPARGHGKLLVIRQSRRRGTKLAANTAIAVYLETSALS